MTSDGANVVATLRHLRTFYQEIGLLLGSADNLIEKHSWKPTGSLVYGGMSYTLSEPQKWLQQDIFRLYRSEHSKNVLMFVTVIVDDIEKPSRVTEPLLTAGCFNYPSEKELGIQLQHFNYSLPRGHLNMPGRIDDGTIITAEHNPTPTSGFVTATTIGMPLLSIENTTALEQRIINPLITEFKSRK
jgi:hypothetical protein